MPQPVGPTQIACSVVIPTRSRPQQLASCLESLAAQDYPRERFEVIVVEDGGRSLHDVTGRFRERLQLRVLERPHLGRSAARNHGAAEARGELVAFTDDDTRPEPGWIRALTTRHAAVPGHALGGRTVSISPHNPYARASGVILDLAYAHRNPRMPNGARFFAASNLALPADRFRLLGGFDPRLRISEDRELCDRWAEHGFGMTYVPEAMIRHATPTSLSQLLREAVRLWPGGIQLPTLPVVAGTRVERIRFWVLRRARAPGAGRARPEAGRLLPGPAPRLAGSDGGRIRLGGIAGQTARRRVVSEPIGIGLIGCGQVAELRHLPALSRLRGASVVALADLDPERARRLSERFAVPRCYREPEELLADGAVEVVGVLAPPADHAELATRALARGKHVLVEKPLATSLEDGERLIAVAAETPAKTVVGFNLRAHVLVQRARELLSGGIGRPDRGGPRSDERQRQRGRRWGPAAGGLSGRVAVGFCSRWLRTTTTSGATSRVPRSSR